MSNTFDWTRFSKVVRKDFNSMLRQYSTILFLAASPALLWLFIWVISSLDPDSSVNVVPEIRLCIILFLTFLTSLLVPGFLYKTMNMPKEGIYFAMLPASKSEKYLSMILFSAIVCPLAVFGCSIVIDLFLTLLPFGPYHDYFWQTSITRFTWNAFFNNEFFQTCTLFSSPVYWVVTMILTYLSYVATFLFGATFFKKHKFLLTLLWIWIIGFALQLVCTPLVGMLVVRHDWLENIITVNPQSAFSVVAFVGLACSIVYTVGLFWWAGHRLKKMTY